MSNEFWNDPILDVWIKTINISRSATMQLQKKCLDHARLTLVGKICDIRQWSKTMENVRIVEIEESNIDVFKIRFFLKKVDGSYGGILRSATYGDICKVHDNA